MGENEVDPFLHSLAPPAMTRPVAAKPKSSSNFLVNIGRDEGAVCIRSFFRVDNFGKNVLLNKCNP